MIVNVYKPGFPKTIPDGNSESPRETIVNNVTPLGLRFSFDRSTGSPLPFSFVTGLTFLLDISSFSFLGKSKDFASKNHTHPSK